MKKQIKKDLYKLDLACGNNLQPGFTGVDLGELLRTYLSGDRAWIGDFDYVYFRRGRRALLQISARPHGQLHDVVRSFCDRGNGVRLVDPARATAVPL